MLPFTRAQFVDVFVDYNNAVWPIQILAYVMGLAMLVMLVRPSRSRDRMIGAGLAAMWIWTGVAYHGLYFSTINKAALIFAALFIVEGALLFYVAVIRGQIRFGASSAMTHWLGWVLVIYASVIYPLLGMWTGHSYPEMPMFGVTPCPVTIFTFGLLLLTVAPVPRWLFAIPIAWSLVGGSAAFLLGVPQDWLLLFSGLAVALVVVRERSRTDRWRAPRTT